MNSSPAFIRLIEAFQKLPGIGPKTAQRLAFHVLKQSQSEVEDFAEALLEAKARIRHCDTCFNISTESPCELCQTRPPQTVCVVPEARDLFALEKTNEYHGQYHVLQGLISPLEGIGPEDLRIQPLIARLADGVQEVILALPPSIEGDTTSLYLSRLIKPLDIPLTRIAYGLPAGGELEYADSLTISRALAGRVSL